MYGSIEMRLSILAHGDDVEEKTMPWDEISNMYDTSEDNWPGTLRPPWNDIPIIGKDVPHYIR